MAVLQSSRPVAELVTGDSALTQEELAAALNVSQATVSNWLRGVRSPRQEHLARMTRALDADTAAAVTVDRGLWRGPVTVPKELWTPAFSPRGRFRLPLRLEWSGSDEQRWRDARHLPRLLTAYGIVMVEGRVGDMVRWIDPQILATHMDDMIWPREYEPVWRAALQRWGLV